MWTPKHRSKPAPKNKGTSAVESGIFLQSFVDKIGNPGPVYSFSLEFYVKNTCLHYFVSIPRFWSIHNAKKLFQIGFIIYIFFMKLCEQLPDTPSQVSPRLVRFDFRFSSSLIMGPRTQNDPRTLEKRCQNGDRNERGLENLYSPVRDMYAKFP